MTRREARQRLRTEATCTRKRLAGALALPCEGLYDTRACTLHTQHKGMRTAHHTKACRLHARSCHVDGQAFSGADIQASLCHLSRVS